MNKSRFAIRILALVIVTIAFSAVAQAQATRTWVSGVGDDVNPCSRTAPCKTFAGAISKTATGGEINVLDPAGFGGVTITKAITISSEGFEAGVLVSAGNGILVNVPNATDFVVLRGLDIEGLGTGVDGIKVITGGKVQVENCTINRFTSSGINFQPTVAGSKLQVLDTIVRNNGNFGVPSGQGIFINPTAAAKADINGVRLENNVAGLKAQGPSNTSVSNSLAGNNSFAGFSAAASGVVLTVENSVSTHNGTGVVCATGATVLLGHSSITANTTALGGTGTCSSFQNNNIDVIVVVTPINAQ